MPALQRAVALAEMHGVAVAVAEHLDFDVARALEIFFEVDCVVAEGGLGFRARGRQRIGSSARVARDLHAAPAAAGGGLDQHRIADLVGDLGGFRVVGDAAFRARHHRNAEALGGALGFDLVAHQADMLGLRADEMTLCSPRISAKRAFSDRKP